MKKLLHTLILCLAIAPAFAQTQTIDIDAELQGDLYKAKSESKQLAIIIAGSGPTDRNGNSLPSLNANSYKLLAEGLQQEGINVFTFDKRIIAKLKNNTIKDYTHDFDENVKDVNLIIAHFKNQYPSITLIGHSEGALMANLATIQNKEVTHFVSLQGAGESIDQIMDWQLIKQMPFFETQIKAIHAQLKSGKPATDIPPMLQGLYNPGNQAYLISWMKYNPTEEIKKVKVPVLIVQGDKDLQVVTEQGELLKKALPTATLTTIKGMNHVLKTVEKDEENLATYSKPLLPLHKEIVPLIANFIKQ